MEKGHYYFKYTIAHWLLLIFGIISIIVGTINLGKGLYWDSYLINVFWVSYNIPGLLIALKIAYQPPRILANEGISIQLKNGENFIVTDAEIAECIKNSDYDKLDSLMESVILNIKPFKSNFNI